MRYEPFHVNKPSFLDLKEARRTARLTPAEAASMCGLHRTTYARQEAGDSRVSVSAHRLLIAITRINAPGFDGWRVRDGDLWTPENVSFSAGEIRSLPYLYALIAEYERQLNRPQTRPEFEHVALCRTSK